MSHIEWNAFENLLDVALGRPPFDREERIWIDRELFRQLYKKYAQLERQREIFHHATEETIQDEYRRMRCCHREFLDCFHKAKQFLENSNH